MADPIVQIQARLGSTRLPGKVLFSLANKRVITRVVTQCRAAEYPVRVVLTVGDRPENDAIVKWCRRAKVDYEQGPEDNLLYRHLDTARAVDADPVVRVTGDCPFIPPDEIDRVIIEHSENDARYTTNLTDGMPIGTAVDVIDRELLEELAERGETHPVKLPREDPDAWNVSFTPNQTWTRFADAHIAVDTPGDYWRLTDAIEAVGDDPLDVARWVSQR